VNIRPLSPLSLLLASGILLTGCRSHFVRREVEKRAERRLADEIGPAAHYRVRILETPEAELVKGRVRRLEMDAKKIHARKQVMIESLRVSLYNLRYEGKRTHTLSFERSDVEVEFSEDAVNRYLAEFQKRYSPSLKFGEDQVTVRMVYPFLGKPTPISATGRLVIREGRQLIFDAEKTDVSFLDSPGFGEKFVEDRVNPLLDLTKVDLPARLESVELLQGKIRAHGSAVLPAELKD
jgi:hypothetical protein